MVKFFRVYCDICRYSIEKADEVGKNIIIKRIVISENTVFGNRRDHIHRVLHCQNIEPQTGCTILYLLEQEQLFEHRKF
jgi:hypothetical protein